MTARTHVTVGDAIRRALVAFPTPQGGVGTGRLLAVGGRDPRIDTPAGPTGKSRRSNRQAVILLASGAKVTRPVEVVRLVLEAPRVVP